MVIHRLLLFTAFSFCFLEAQVEPTLIEEHPELGKAFQTHQLIGTFAYRDPSTNSLKVWNRERAVIRYIPASTFKIANTVIGLDCGAATNIDQIFPYGGKPQRFKEWERDMPLREAIVVSAVPIYQELARRIGPKRMAAGLEKLEYGNRQIGTEIDQFWLEGPLTISAMEQVEFLNRLLSGGFPVTQNSVEGLKEIIQKEPLGDGTLHYKTGWCVATTPQTGWIVGWLQHKDGRIAPFALNIDMSGKTDADKRLPLARTCILNLIESKTE